MPTGIKAEPVTHTGFFCFHFMMSQLTPLLRENQVTGYSRQPFKFQVTKKVLYDNLLAELPLWLQTVK